MLQLLGARLKPPWSPPLMPTWRVLIGVQQALQRCEKVRHQILARQPTRVAPRLDDARLMDSCECLGLIEQLHEVRRGNLGFTHQIIGTTDAGTGCGLIPELASNIIDRPHEVLIIDINAKLRLQLSIVLRGKSGSRGACRNFDSICLLVDCLLINCLLWVRMAHLPWYGYLAKGGCAYRRSHLHAAYAPTPCHVPRP